MLPAVAPKSRLGSPGCFKQRILMYPGRSGVRQAAVHTGSQTAATPAGSLRELVESHKEQHMTALQVQAELPPRVPPTRKLTREVSSAISESAAKRAEALAAMEAQVSETKLSLEVGDTMLAAAAAQQGRQSNRLHCCMGCWTLALPVQRVLLKCCQGPSLAAFVEHPASLGLSASIREMCCMQHTLTMCCMQHTLTKARQTLLLVRCVACQGTAGVGRPCMHCATWAGPNLTVKLCCPPAGREDGPPGGCLAGEGARDAAQGHAGQPDV